MVKCTKVCIGELNKKLVFQTRVQTFGNADSVDITEVFTSVATMWGKLTTIPQTGNKFNGVEIDSIPTHLAIIRYNASINAECWMLFNSRRFEILHISNIDEDGKFMSIELRETGLDSLEAAKVGR